MLSIIETYLQANSIHATIPKNLAPSFKRLLHVYVITKFDVSDKKETYVVVKNNPSLIEFCLDTIVTEEESDDNIIQLQYIAQVIFNLIYS